MRSILEKAIVHLLNEEQDKAEALFHKFMVEKARRIHESLRQGEEVVLTEGWDDEITSEEYFTESDLDDAVDADADVDADTADVDADTAEIDADTAQLDGAADEITDDLGDEDMGDMGDFDAGEEPVEGDVSLEDQVASIEDKIDDLTAEFERMMAEIEGDEGDVDADVDAVDADVDADADMADRMEDDVTADADSSDMDADTTEATDEMDDADLEDITESVLAELEKVSVTLSDGTEVGAGGKKVAGANHKSPVPGQAANNRGGAEPVTRGKGGHEGFERETAPPVQPVTKLVKGAKNSKKNWEDGRKAVSKEGDKSAALNKDYAGSKNTKSAID